MDWLTLLQAVFSVSGLTGIFAIVLLGFFLYFVIVLMKKLTSSMDKLAGAFDKISASIEKMINSNVYMEKEMNKMDYKMDQVLNAVQFCKIKNKN